MNRTVAESMSLTLHIYLSKDAWNADTVIV